LGPVAAQVREERDDADSDPALGQRLSRADRAGRTVVPRAEVAREDSGDRVLPERESQSHSHRRTKAYSRVDELAALLVRQVHGWERRCRCAGPAVGAESRWNKGNTN